MVAFREITTGLRFPEGPIAMPDGVVVLVEIEGRRLTRVHPDGRKEVICETEGGPNGAAIGPDGRCYICNNGGFAYTEDEYGLRSIGQAEDSSVASQYTAARTSFFELALPDSASETKPCS